MEKKPIDLKTQEKLPRNLVSPSVWTAITDGSDHAAADGVRVRTPPTLKFTLNEILVEPEELDLKESLSDPGTLATYVKNLRDYKKQLDAEQERHRKSGLLLGLIRS
eukprot:m.53464 g.53464  ORF g.53464 m.53464 type:complete len:107 (-) comp6483_c0_seq2:1585-1905(-)